MLRKEEKAREEEEEEEREGEEEIRSEDERGVKVGQRRRRGIFLIIIAEV